MWLEIGFAIVVAIALVMVLNKAYVWYVGKHFAKMLASEEFEAASRGKQTIDLRAKDVYKQKHVMGARSIPYELLKDNFTAIRKDQPVFLYDQNAQVAARLAKRLYKAGYQDINILEGGFGKYTGKTKVG